MACTITGTAADAAPPRARSGWLGVAALASGTFTLVSAEFLPAGVLPLLAADFGISEGVAGQTVTATALTGAITGLSITSLAPRVERKRLLLTLSTIAVIANLLIALAPWFALVIVGRLLLGISIAGFWAMALAVAARLVPAGRVGRAMAFVNSGIAAATVVSIPLGAYLSDVVGWRFVFVGATAVTLVALIFQAFAFPPLPAIQPTAGVRELLRTLRVPAITVILVGTVVTVTGQFTAYTYVRPALELASASTPQSIALTLTVYGGAAFIGTLFFGLFMDRHLRLLSVLLPLLLATGIVLVTLSTSTPALPPLVGTVLWGAAFGALPAMFQTSIARTAPERLEPAGGLLTTAFQAAIASGAALGGLMVDSIGVIAALLIAASGVVAGGAVLSSRRA